MLIRQRLGMPLYVLHGLCNFPGLVSLSGEGVWRQAAERCMRSGLTVISPPLLNPLGLPQSSAAFNLGDEALGAKA
jgi:hypothetical protein